MSKLDMVDNDNLHTLRYDEFMAGAAAHIIVRIKASRPIELGDFVSAFTSIANQYDKFIRERHPDLGPEAGIFVSEVRRGSIVADLIPFLTHDLIGGIASVVDPLEQIAVTHEFIRHKGRCSKLILRRMGKTQMHPSPISKTSWVRSLPSRMIPRAAQR
jgi:hypothetical protein